MFQDITQGPGQLSATSHTMEILIMLLVAFLLGLLLGYILWYRWRKLYLELQTEHDRLKAQHLDLEKDHASLRYKLEQSEKENAGLHNKVRSLEGDLSAMKFKLEKSAADLAAAAASAGVSLGAVAVQSRNVAAAPLVKDDLKKVEGIGPKIEELCNGIGIYTWAQLADTSVETLQKMLDDAGPAYRISDPGTWPKQAKLAAEGKWDELEKYQEFLDGGKDPG
jgi:predicted flap endonuclease-1-like 5' DNA nuclease